MGATDGDGADTGTAGGGVALIARASRARCQRPREGGDAVDANGDDVNKYVFAADAERVEDGRVERGTARVF